MLGVLGRNDEPEMMPIAFAALGERPMVGVVTFGVEHPARGAVLGYAFTPQIDQVGIERRSASFCAVPRGP